MKRRIGVGIVVAALVAALVWWWSRGEDTKPEHGASRAASSVVEQTSKRSIERIDPRTQPRGSIGGTVRDEASAPIAGARVCADLSSYELPGELTRDPICTTTDARGAYTLKDLLAARYTVVAGAKTYRPATFHPEGDRRTSWFPLAAGETKTGVDLVLRTGGVEITGVVSDVSGGPIAGARVRASAGWWGGNVAGPVVETDEEGAFSLWVRAGQVRVDATADGYGDASERGRAPGSFELLLTPESSLSGIVVDATSGAPIEGARVEVSAGWFESDQSTRSDAEGRFRVAKLTPGRYVATARTERGYGRSEGSTRVGLGEHVEGVVVKLHAAARITGTVRIPGATPATCIKARVSFRDDANERWVRARTEPDGTVITDGVLPGRCARTARAAARRSPSTSPSARPRSSRSSGPARSRGSLASKADLHPTSSAWWSAIPGRAFSATRRSFVRAGGSRSTSCPPGTSR